VCGTVGVGLLVLLGIHRDDTEADAAYVADKIVGLRVFGDEGGKMNRSVVDAAGSALVISQFTLFGDVRHGKRPSFVEAAPPELAVPLYESVCARIAGAGVPVQRGAFGAHMVVSLVNDGPVTIQLDSKKLY
jgi:D-tyrosyl-tRNA(Tyr) deacylase